MHSINKEILLQNHTTSKQIMKLILIHYYSPQPMQVLLIVLIMSFIAKGSSLESNIAFSCPVSLVCFNSLSLSFVTLTLCKNTGQVVLQNGPKFDVSSWLDANYVSLAPMPQKWSCALFHCILSDGMQFLFVPLTSDVHLDHWIKVVFASFSIVKLL